MSAALCCSMSLASPFNIRPSILLMEFLEAGHEVENLGFRRVALGVIGFGGADDDIDDVREAAAATAAFFHRMIDFGRHDQLPAVLVEEANDRVFNVFVGDEIATANQHFVLPVERNALNSSIKQKRMFSVNKKLPDKR
ncbi:hypothetical protein J2Z31_004217 [Sinorhizobium kostiense]|uniref:Uncharacterized protein n=1 Tax=Sinorhizobium kostiense TaxID=76747 RepID=A0ABS4R4R3_9HYPH|nr:hypothetical protein [Sinorhizobium kostiense]